MSCAAILATAGALAAAGGFARGGNASTVQTKVGLPIPAGACDCHVHCIPDPAQFPLGEGRLYTPPVASADDLLALQSALHMDRVVIVTPSIYGIDNAATLYAIQKLGLRRARGVAAIGPATPAAELNAMNEGGIRGVRVNLGPGGAKDLALAASNLNAAVAQIRDQPWNIEIYARLSVVAALEEQLAALPMPVVLDHFAGAQASLGTDQPGFDAVLRLVGSGGAYVKLSAVYRASDVAPGYPDLAPFAQALVAANPDRVLWGTDWPHPGGSLGAKQQATDIMPPTVVDDGRVLNLLAEWAPDPAVRRKILVDNPARLYGF
jgi:predicted TIM-barrel fold metal-dependent hydrolase